MFRLKKIDFLLLRNFIGPFLLVFGIVMFIMVMQFLWKYIDDLVGKGLNWYVIAELLFYMSSTLVPLAIPIAILLSSIMTLGGLGEYYELTAMKSSGRGLPRIMGSLIIFSIFMAVCSFLFSNYVLPVANLKGLSLLYDVREQKPALNIKDGIFYNGINGFSIWVSSKDGDGQTIRKVYIYDHTEGRGNVHVLYADRGKMSMSEDKKYLQVELYNGNQYQELAPTTQDQEKNFEQTRTFFKEWRKTFDLSDLSFSRTKEDLFKENYQMKNMEQLTAGIDTYRIHLENDRKQFLSSIRPVYFFSRNNADSSMKLSTGNTNYESLLSPQQRSAMLAKAIVEAKNIKGYTSFHSKNYFVKNNGIVNHEIEIQRKFAYAFGCIVMLLIGAPLGAIIRKGGIGWPIVIAIFFFAAYYILSVVGEKLAKTEFASPFIGMWFSSFILLPLGLFLMYKSTNDSLLFNGEQWTSASGKLLRFILRRKEKI